MLWQHYIYRRGLAVHDLWDGLFEDRKVKLLYIAGRGFDIRSQAVMSSFVEHIQDSGRALADAELTLVGFSGYQLSDELLAETENNASTMGTLFRKLSSNAVID